MIFKNSLSKSDYNVKNSWKFQKIIATKTIPDGHVMISLDVVAMFSNIPLDLVKKAVLNRWIKVKSHTKLKIWKGLFLRGWDLYCLFIFGMLMILYFVYLWISCKQL